MACIWKIRNVSMKEMISQNVTLVDCFFSIVMLRFLDTIKIFRILGCFKLNPFEHLKLSFDSAPDEVKKQYRKVTRHEFDILRDFHLIYFFIFLVNN